MLFFCYDDLVFKEFRKKKTNFEEFRHIVTEILEKKK